MNSLRVLSRLKLRLQQSMLETAPQVEVAGIPVFDWEVSAPDDRTRIFHTAGAAIESIRAASPLQFRRVQRSIRRIVEYLPGANGIYCSDREAAVLSKDMVLRDGPWQAALTIIHEATHAHLALKGYEYTEEKRGQIERICRKRELAHIRCFEGEEGVAEWITWMHARLDDAGATDDELRSSHRQRLLLQMKYNGAPEALLRLLAWLAAQSDKRRAAKDARLAPRRGA